MNAAVCSLPPDHSTVCLKRKWMCTFLKTSNIFPLDIPLLLFARKKNVTELQWLFNKNQFIFNLIFFLPGKQVYILFMFPSLLPKYTYSCRCPKPICRSFNYICPLTLTGQVIIFRKMMFKANADVIKTFPGMSFGYFFRHCTVHLMKNTSKNNLMCILILKKCPYPIRIFHNPTELAKSE